MMRKVRPDPKKAIALRKMADHIMERVRETDEERFPSQVLKDHYEALHCLLEALACERGVKADGEGAHERLIRWAAGALGLSGKEAALLDQMRVLRNRISYEGLMIDVPCAEQEGHCRALQQGSQ